jgi:drug/metabolite transporter (DMT)-like permease
VAIADVPIAPPTASRKATAGVALFVASFGWGMAPVFIRYLSHAYDPYAQMFIRYGSGALALTLLCLVAFRSEFLRTLRHSARIMPLACVTLLHQWAWTHGTYGSTATVSQLTTKLSVTLIIAFSFFLFHEERAVIRSPWYLAGTLLSLVGVAGVLAKDASSLLPLLDGPSLMLLTTALFWAVYVVGSKHLVYEFNPLVLFTVLALWASAGFLVMTLLFGDIGTLVAAGPRITVVAVVSGLIPIAAAHPCYNYAQKYLGAALSSSLNLINPLFTYGTALLLWPDEHLLPTQWLGAALLLGGTVLVTVAARTARSLRAPNFMNVMPGSK